MKFKRTIAAVTIVTILAGCTTINPQTGKAEIDPNATAALGALGGAVVGAMTSGKKDRMKGALIGAAAVGGLTYAVTLKMRKEELAKAQFAAKEIRQETGLTPTVATTTYTDDQSGETTTGLGRMEIAAPAKATIIRGRLSPKAAAAFTKMDGMADPKENNLTIAVPPSTTMATLEDIKLAAPSAKIVTGDESRVVATLMPRGVQLASAQ